METAAPRRTTGRPRDRHADDAILEAAIALIAEQGVDETSTAEIAARAHAGKDTIYRRWAHKDDLVHAALERLIVRHRLPPPTGSALGDLRAWAADLAHALAHTALGPILLALAARSGHDPAAAGWLDRHAARLDEEVVAILERHGHAGDARWRAAAGTVADACHARWMLGRTLGPADRAWAGVTALSRQADQANRSG